VVAVGGVAVVPSNWRSESVVAVASGLFNCASGGMSIIPLLSPPSLDLFPVLRLGSSADRMSLVGGTDDCFDCLSDARFCPLIPTGRGGATSLWGSSCAP